MNSAWLPTHKPYSFRPTPDLEARLTAALAATNARPGEMLAACVDRALDDVTQELIEARRTAEAALLKAHRSKDPPPKRRAG